MSGCAFYTAVPAWLQVLQVLVEMGFMVTLAVVAIMVARQYGRRVDLKVAEKAVHDAKHAVVSKPAAPAGTATSGDAAKSAETAKSPELTTPAPSGISVEPFVD